MSAMADLHAAIEDLAEGRDLDAGQIELVRRYIDGMPAATSSAIVGATS